MFFQRFSVRLPHLSVQSSDPVLINEVSEVPVGQECGMAFENYEDIRAGDVIEAFRVEHVTRTL